MRLRRKITFTTAIVGLLLLVLGVASAGYVLWLQRLNSRILDVNVSNIRAAEKMEILVREIRHELDRFLVTLDQGHLVRAIERQQDVNVWLEHARTLSVAEREAALVAEIQRGLDEFRERLRQLVDTPSAAVSKETVERLVDDVLTRKVLANAHQYLELNEQKLQDSNQENKAMAERLAFALLLLGSCGAIGGLVIGYGIARGVSRSIFQLSVPIRDVAGKLDELVGPLEVSADPSVQELETMLRELSAKVGTVVEQLHARHREVIRADQLAAVGQLAAGLAHELRNPLMSMKVLVQSAARRGSTATLDARDLQVLDEEITRLENLLQAFLDFARPAKLEKDKLDLANVVGQTVDFFSGRAARRNVTIEFPLPHAPIVVEADAAQLRQVLLNLLLNALDAVRNGGRIWVSVGYEDSESIDVQPGGRSQGSVCLRVADNGRGLPPDERHRICEPFFSTKETGLGLGLAISQRIIQAHGGKLAAMDREGGGAVVQVNLPLRGAPCQAVNASLVPEIPGAPAAG